MEGSTILEQRQYAKQHLDHLRTMLMSEPRGHLDMYGALLVPPTHPEAHMAVLFMHNEGRYGGEGLDREGWGSPGPPHAPQGIHGCPLHA